MFLTPLLKEPLDKSTLKSLCMVISQLNLLLSLVNGVIDMSTIEANCYEKKTTSFDPNKVLEFMIEMFDR